MACCNIIIGGLMDAKYCKILGPGPAGPRIDVLYTRHRMSQRSTDTSDSIHYSLLQCYYLPVNVRCLRVSLSVTDNGSHSGTPFDAPFVHFLRDKFYTEFSPATISKKMTCSKFWLHVIRGPLSSRGPYVRAYRA